VWRAGYINFLRHDALLFLPALRAADEAERIARPNLTLGLGLAHRGADGMGETLKLESTVMMR
jgi:hypothetical protein